MNLLDNVYVVLIILSGLIVSASSLAHKDKSRNRLVFGLLIIGIGLVSGIIAVSRYNLQMDNNIRYSGPTFIDRLLSEEPLLMQDQEFPELVSKIAGKLNYPPEIVKALGYSGNYTITFHLRTNGVLAATNELPKAP